MSAENNITRMACFYFGQKVGHMPVDWNEAHHMSFPILSALY